MADSKLKITVLYESWGEEEEAAPEPEKKKRGAKKRRKKREKHDSEEIFEALEKLGHEPSCMMLDAEDKSRWRWPSRRPTCSSTLWSHTRATTR
jgi:D-alanine-D-alanine ligase